MSCKEQQEEEIEVLKSIYDGDGAFKQVSETVFQYKIGEDGDNRAYLLEVCWGEEYPEQLPDINIDAFYNKHILEEVKTSVVKILTEQAEDLLGTAMTYTLFEYAKEEWAELMKDQPEVPLQSGGDTRGEGSSTSDVKAKPKAKKEQLTKAQKRKIVNKMDNMGELPRGHDWVDIVKHLSQSGYQQS